MSYFFLMVRYPSRTSSVKFPAGFVTFAKKMVASWLWCKVGTLKIPLRANTVTGTKKFSQCFADTDTEEARRAKTDQDGRYMVRAVSDSWSRGLGKHRMAREATEDLCKVDSERRKDS